MNLRPAWFVSSPLRALSICGFARHHPADAKLLASFRREDLLRNARSSRLLRELEELNRPLERVVAVLAQRLFGRPTSKAVAKTLLAVIDIPMAMVRRCLLARHEVPEWLRQSLESAVRAVVRSGEESSWSPLTIQPGSTDSSEAAAMSNLILASVFLPLSHFGLSSSPLRATLVGKLGEQRFLTLYKLITLAAFAWLIASYRNAPSLIIWTPSSFAPGGA
jgi:hypothetical protein